MKLFMRRREAFQQSTKNLSGVGSVTDDMEKPPFHHPESTLSQFYDKTRRLYCRVRRDTTDTNYIKEDL